MAIPKKLKDRKSQVMISIKILEKRLKTEKGELRKVNSLINKIK